MLRRRASTVPDHYFEKLYNGDRDPWQSESSAYEQAKYQATLAAIGPPRLGRVFEVGCAIGVLTAQLAPLCDGLVAVDVAEAALAQARIRCAALTHVQLERMRIPNQWPVGTFDLILLSEMLYYLVDKDIAATARLALDSLNPGGRIVLVNWLGDTGGPCTGEQAADTFLTACRGQAGHDRCERAEAYRLDVLRRLA